MVKIDVQIVKKTIAVSIERVVFVALGDDTLGQMIRNDGHAIAGAGSYDKITETFTIKNLLAENIYTVSEINAFDRFDITTTDISNWNTAFLLSHSHSNKTVLDGISNTEISQRNSAYALSHSHSNKSVLDGIDTSSISNRNSAYSLSHSHTNKTLLDSIISSGDGTKYLADDGTYKTITVGVTDHASLSNLGFADSGHTGFQATLVSTTNIKSINGSTILGSGNLVVTATMVYPGAGIPISTGSAWGTSITDNSANRNTAYGRGNHASAGYQTALGFTPENVANKSTDIITDASSTTKYPSIKLIKDYADSLVAGLLDYRGGYDASGNVFPTTGGSGTAGAVVKGDMRVISVVGTIGGVVVKVGDSIIANCDTPGQTAGNWNMLNTNIGYVPENSSNKVTSISGSSTDIQYPSAKLLFDQLAGKQASGLYLTAVAGTQLDNVWSSNGILVRTGTATYSTITDSHSNRDTAYGWGNHASAGYLTSLAGAILSDQTTPQTIGDTTNRLLKIRVTDITCTNAITGSVTGNAGTVSGLTITAGAVISGSNTGDETSATIINKIGNPKLYHGVLSRLAVAPLPTNLTTTTFTLSTNTTPITYFYQGTQVVVNTAKTATLDDGVGGTSSGLYYVYFNGATGNILATKTFPGIAITSNVIIAMVFWNGSDYGIVYDERHAYDRNCQRHIWAHSTIGARYQSGLDFSFAGNVYGNTTFALSTGTIYDEDIGVSVAGTTARIWYQTGATTYTFDNVVSTTPYRTDGTGIFAVNSGSSPTPYSLVKITASNRYFNYRVYGTTSNLAPIHIFCETVTNSNAGGYTSANNARAVQAPSLVGMGLSPEYKLLYRIVVNGAGLIQTPIAGDDYRTTSTVSGGALTTVSASSVTENVYGNVQSAINSIISNYATLANPTFSGVLTAPNITLPTNGQILMTIPTTDGHATGKTTNAFNSGYSTTAIGDLVYLDSNGTRQLCDANTELLYNGMLGIALEVKTSGQALLVALPGSFVYATGFPPMTIGLPVYMSETPGAITHTKPTTGSSATRTIGRAIHADKIFFNPSSDYGTV